MWCFSTDCRWPSPSSFSYGASWPPHMAGSSGIRERVPSSASWPSRPSRPSRKVCRATPMEAIRCCGSYWGSRRAHGRAMRILALSQWYPPEPDIRAGVLARELADRCHAVTALTGFPNYPNGRIYPGYEQRLRSVERDGAARVVRVPLYPSHSHSAFGRVLTYGTFAASAMLLGGPATGSIDVVWAYHPPITTGLAAVVIGAARRAPFVFEIQDMWPETLAATGMVRGGAFLSGVGAMARWIYERAAAISVISPGFKRNLIAKGVSGEKIVVIPNWADETVYRPMPRDPTAARAAGLPTGFIVLYAGNMGPAQDLLNVLRAAKQLTDLAEVRFVFVG